MTTEQLEVRRLTAAFLGGWEDVPRPFLASADVLGDDVDDRPAELPRREVQLGLVAKIKQAAVAMRSAIVGFTAACEFALKSVDDWCDEVYRGERPLDAEDGLAWRALLEECRQMADVRLGDASVRVFVAQSVVDELKAVRERLQRRVETWADPQPAMLPSMRRRFATAEEEASVREFAARGAMPDGDPPSRDWKKVSREEFLSRIQRRPA